MTTNRAGLPTPVDPRATPARTLTRPVVGVVAGVVVGAIAVVVGVTVSGTVGVTGLLDPGVVVRWSAPVVTVLMQLTVSVTLGALLLAVAVLPRQIRRAPEGGVWPAVTTIAGTAAGAWTLLSVADLVLTYSTIAGIPPDAGRFGAELGLFVGSVSSGRILLSVVALAAVTTVLALLADGPRGAAVAAVPAVAAIGLWSQTGHASGGINHELAVGAMFLHLMGAALWIGGLGGIALLAHRLGSGLPCAVARWSPVAAWSLAAVGISGLVSSGLRLRGIGDLTTTYGALLLTKVVLTGLLALLGLAHRRHVIPRLVSTEAGRVPRLFWRLVAVELAIMGAVSGVAAALGRTPPPAPQNPSGELSSAQIVTGAPLPPAPTAALWLTSFRWEAITAVACLAALVVYLRWTWRLHTRGDRWPLGRTLSAAIGLVLLVWATSGGPAVYGHVLFSAHMIKTMMLLMVVPTFLALSAPVTLAARALPARGDGSLGPREWLLALVHSRWTRFWAHPVVAVVNFAGSMLVFYYTPAFEYELTTQVGQLLMIAHFSVTGYLVVNALIGIDPGPDRLAYQTRLGLLFGALVFYAIFGGALVRQQTLLVPTWFGVLGRPWGPTALEDQQASGPIVWSIGEVAMLALAIGIALAWMKDHKRTARLADSEVERDGEPAAKPN